MKRQFSSLSRCPSCDKVYLGYQRMALHFQKYPEHRNEELLRCLLIRSKKKALDENNSLYTVSGKYFLSALFEYLASLLLCLFVLHGTEIDLEFVPTIILKKLFIRPSMLLGIID